MGFKVFTAGSVLTASDLNEYLMEQANIVCTSGTRPVSPHEGMEIYETDTDKKLIYDGSSWVEFGGGTWASFTPSWTSNGSAPSLGNGTLSGAYLKRGDTIDFRIRLIMGSTTNFGSGQWSFSLPELVNETTACAAVAYDVSTALRYAGAAFLEPEGPPDVFRVVFGTGGGGAAQAVPFSWANTDQLYISGTYEWTT